jgi:hypothetical protein
MNLNVKSNWKIIENVSEDYTMKEEIGGIRNIKGQKKERLQFVVWMQVKNSKGLVRRITSF